MFTYAAIQNPTYLRNQDLVTNVHAHGHAISLLIKRARPDGKYLGLVQVLDGALGEEDSGRGLALGFHSLDKDAVQEGREALNVAESGLHEKK